MSAVAAASQDGGQLAASRVWLLTRRRIYILPTRAGWMFAGCLAAMLLGAVNYNNSLAYLLTFALASLALVSMLHTYRNQVGLCLTAVRAQPVHAGELATYEVQIENTAPYARVGLMLRYDAGAQVRGGDDPAAAAGNNWQLLRFDVPPSDSVKLTLSVSSSRRGWLPLAPLTLSNRYPLGLFRAWSNVDLEMKTLVYPAAAGARELPALHGDGAGEAGNAPDGIEDFDGLRAYRAGDSPRRVHWKAAARSRELPVKMLSGGSGSEFSFAWSGLAGPVEQRLSQLALWIAEAERGGHRYMLDLPGVRIPAGAGAAHMHRCLSALALFGTAGDA